jgi:hypothetical protein
MYLYPTVTLFIAIIEYLDIHLCVLYTTKPIRVEVLGCLVLEWDWSGLFQDFREWS